MVNTLEEFLEDDELRELKTTNFKILVNDHSTDCERCHQNGLCQLQHFARNHSHSFSNEKVVAEENDIEVIDRGYSLDHGRCINCSLCVDFSKKIFKDGFFSKKYRGKYTKVSFNLAHIDEVDLSHYRDLCPTGAIYHETDRRTGSRSSWSRLDCHLCEKQCQLSARSIDQRFLDLRNMTNESALGCEAGRLFWQRLDFWRLNSTILKQEQNQSFAPIFLEEIEASLPKGLTWQVLLPTDLYQNERHFWSSVSDDLPCFSYVCQHDHGYASHAIEAEICPKFQFESLSAKALIIVESFCGFDPSFLDEVSNKASFVVLISFNRQQNRSANLQLERNGWMSEYKLFPPRQMTDFQVIMKILERKV